MIIPRGKVVVIKANAVNILPGIDLVLTEDVVIKLSSQFEQLISGSGNKIFDVLTKVAFDIAGKSVGSTFKEFGLSVWKGTEPLSFSFTVILSMKSDAQKDVWNPARQLLKLPLPTDLWAEGKGVGLLAPGPSVLDALNINLGLRDKSLTNKYSIHIGNFKFNPMLIKSVEPIFSNETDTYGYPIWCTLKIDAIGINTATTQDIDNMINLDVLLK